MWLQRLEEEHDNLRSALEWSLAEAGSGTRSSALRSAATLLDHAGHFAEGREWCARVLEKAGTEERTQERAKVLNGAGLLAYHQSDYPAAAACFEESLAIERQLGDRQRIATSLGNLGLVAYDQGDLASARALHEEQPRDHAGTRGPEWHRRRNEQPRGRRQSNRATLPLHARCSSSAWRSSGNSGDRGRIANSLAISRMWRSIRATLPLPGRCTRSAWRSCGNWEIARGIANSLNSLGRVATSRATIRPQGACSRGEPGDHAGTAAERHRRLAAQLGNVACEQGDHSSRQGAVEEGLAIRHARGDRRAIASSLEGMAAVVAALGSSLSAARIWGAAERLRDGGRIAAVAE